MILKTFSHYCILTGFSGPSPSISKGSQDLRSDRPKLQVPVLAAGKKAGRIDFRHSAFLQGISFFNFVLAFFEHFLASKFI